MKQPQKSPRVTYLPGKLGAFVWWYLKDKKLYLLGYFLIALVWAVELSLTPYLLKLIIDTVTKYPTDHAKMLAASMVPATIYVLMTIVVNLNFRIYEYLNFHLFPYLKSAVDRDMFAYLLNHSHAFFQNSYTGSLTKKISDMAVNIEPLISIPNEWFYPQVFALIIASATLFKVVHPIFGLFLFSWTIIFTVITYIASKKSELLSRELSAASSRFDGALSDAIANIISIKLFSNIQYEIDNLEKIIACLVKSDRKLQWYNLKINFIQGVGVTLLTISMLGGLIYGNAHDIVSAGDFALVLMLSISFMWSVHDVGKQMQRYFKVVGICNHALTFVKVTHEIKDSSNAKPLQVTQGHIQFQKVSFHYPKSPPLFSNLNVSIQPGEKVGLVGFSGGGKSTFIKLILRLIDPQHGSILIDNQNIKKSTKHSLRQQIGTIPQETDLFHRTILENIRFARMDASDDEVIAAAKAAKCHEFIMEMPEQYHTMVGERGVKLSGGQKQRLSIARAFLKNAPILLLDEATSSLDSVTERYIHIALHHLFENKTTLVIAHRLSTLKDMDRIIVFMQGKIVEDGTLAELLKNKKGYFFELWHMQASGFLPV